MRKIYLQKKFDFIVPDQVIEALWNMYRKGLEKNLIVGSLMNNNEPSVEVMEIMTNKNKALIDKSHATQIEIHKLRNVWEFIDDDVILVEKFITQHFSTCYQFRFDKLYSDKLLGWHAHHTYPRVFIPMHENNCRFMIYNSTEKLSNIYQLGTCWMWDVRENHQVDNTGNDNDRIMACFSIDPAIESKADIFV